MLNNQFKNFESNKVFCLVFLHSIHYLLLRIQMSYQQAPGIFSSSPNFQISFFFLIIISIVRSGYGTIYHPPPPGYPSAPPQPPPPPYGYPYQGYPPPPPQYPHCDHHHHHHDGGGSGSGCVSFLQGWYVPILHLMMPDLAQVLLAYITFLTINLLSMCGHLCFVQNLFSGLSI